MVRCPFGAIHTRTHTHTHTAIVFPVFIVYVHYFTSPPGGSHSASYSSRSTCSSSQRSSVRAFCRSESLRCICCVASGARKKGSGELSQSMPQHGHGHTVTGFTNRKEDVPPHPPWSAAASAPAPRPPSAPPCSQQPQQQSHQRRQQQQGPARHPLPRLVLVPVLLPLLRPHCWRWRCVGAGPRRQSHRGRPGPSPARSAPRATPPLCHVCLGWGGVHRRWRRWTSRKDSCLPSCLRRRWDRPTRHTNTRINTSPSHLARAWRWSGSAPAAPPPRPASACGSRCLQDGAGVCGSVNRRVLPDPSPAARTRR